MLTIQDAIKSLREWKGKQTRYVLIDGRGDRCALGVLGGDDLKLVSSTTYSFKGDTDKGILRDTTVDRIGEAYGIPLDLVVRMIQWNDINRLTFSQIADRLEAENEGRGNA